jgi:hypothetical protein
MWVEHPEGWLWKKPEATASHGSLLFEEFLGRQRVQQHPKFKIVQVATLATYT